MGLSATNNNNQNLMEIDIYFLGQKFKTVIYIYTMTHFSTLYLVLFKFGRRLQLGTGEFEEL